MATANGNSSGGDDLGAKSGDGYQDPPILLMATVLPPETAYETVTIDEDTDDIMMAHESTPLVATTQYSNNINNIINHSSRDQDNSGIPIEVESQNGEHSKPSLEGPIFRDRIFAGLFIIQFVTVVVVGIVYSPRGYEDLGQIMNYTFIREQIELQSDDMTPEQWDEFDSFVNRVSDYISVYASRILVWNIFPCAIFAFVWVYVAAIFIVQPFAKLVVQASLILTVFATALGILVFLLPSLTVATLIFGVILGAAVIYYVQLVWPMIPFAAVNLKIALAGIHDNVGIQIWAFFFCKLGLLWILYWCYATFGIMSYLDDKCGGGCTSDKSHNNDEDPTHRWLGTKKVSVDDNNNNSNNDCGQGGIFFLLLLSGYWTSKVIMNFVEVTIAGVVATWCYDKEAASGCCSIAVGSSIYRSATYSFGSICLGSLLQGLMQVVRKIVPDPRSRRVNNDQTCCGLCFCVFECCGRVLEDVLDYFHQWAYVFVGIYGYGYVESGRKVLELFVSKGWTAIISERLATYVTGCITVAIGVLTGFTGWACTIIVDCWYDDSDPTLMEYIKDGSSASTHYVYGAVPRYVSFFLGFALGTVTAFVMMSIVRGSLNTLIVCFADAPARMEANHPEYTQELIDAWAESFPDLIQKSAFEPPTAEPVTTETQLVY